MHNPSTISLFTPDDIPAILQLLRLNTPEYFAPAEEKDLVQYLHSETEYYFVVRQGEEVAGCGGINYRASGKTACLSWDIIHPAFQGKGIGKSLVQYRLQYIRDNSSPDEIIVRTTQLVYPFYEKCGFQLIETTPDFWAPGYDLYYMKYKPV